MNDANGLVVHDKRFIFVIGTHAEYFKIEHILRKLPPERVLLVSTRQQAGLHSLLEDDSRAESVVLGRRDFFPSTVVKMIIWSVIRIHQLLNLFGALRFPRGEAFVIVQGDTVTALLGAVAARVMRLRVMHVEAGLRSNNILNPFPEELNRIILTALSHTHFAPGVRAVANLASARGSIVDTHQNTCIEGVVVPRQKPNLPDWCSAGFALVSLHRFELFSSPYRYSALFKEIADLCKVARVVMICDPRLQSRFEHRSFRSLQRIERLLLLQRMGREQFLGLMQDCDLLITDSGGQQEEAYYLGVPTLIHRKSSERWEGIGSNAILSRFHSGAFVSSWQERESLRRAPLRMEGPSPSDLISKHMLRDLERGKSL